MLMEKNRNYESIHTHNKSNTRKTINMFIFHCTFIRHCDSTPVVICESYKKDFIGECEKTRTLWITYNVKVKYEQIKKSNQPGKTIEMILFGAP